MKDSNVWQKAGVVIQALSSIATFAAVLVALRGQKSLIKVRAYRDGLYMHDGNTFKLIKHVGNINVAVSNIGMKKVEITSVGYRMPHDKYTTTKEELEQIPKTLEPGEHITIKFKLDGDTKKCIEKFHTFYVTDGCGKFYYEEANIGIRIIRFIWLSFAKYTKKYYKFYKDNKDRFKEPKR